MLTVRHSNMCRPFKIGIYHADYKFRVTDERVQYIYIYMVVCMHIFHPSLADQSTDMAHISN